MALNTFFKTSLGRECAVESRLPTKADSASMPAATDEWFNFPRQFDKRRGSKNFAGAFAMLSGIDFFRLP